MSSPVASPGPWLSSYDSDVSDKDDDDLTSKDNVADVVGDITVCSSYADNPDLTHFDSVADLQRTPGASAIDFFLFCLESPAGGMGHEAFRAARLPPSPSPSLTPSLALGRPVRDSRVNMGHSADLALESDVNRVGLLPSSYAKVVVPGLHTLGPADYRHSWVQDSHFCAGGGKGLSFTNYDAPGRPSAYWFTQRRDRLSEEARARCLAHYPLPR
jgi:hypothetical protein